MGVYRIPPGIAFIGYDSTEISIVIISKYKAETNWTEFISSDTIYPAHLYRKGDTIAASQNSGFYTISKVYSEEYDFKINLPVAGRTHLITKVTPGSSSYGWEQDRECGSSPRSTAMAYEGMTIDGIIQQPASVEMISDYPRVVYITKQ